MSKKNFKIVKNNSFKKVVGSLALALGMVFPVGCSITKEEPSRSIVSEVKQGKKITEADDTLILAWASETADKIDSLESSNYPKFMQCYTTYHCDEEQNFTEMFLSYYSYLDYKEMDEPAELMGDVVNSTYQKYKASAVAYNSGLSEEYQFENSIFAEGIVKLEDEMMAENSEECVYYLPLNRAIAEGRISDKYSIENLPEGSIIENNQLYVSSETIRKEKTLAR